MAEGISGGGGAGGALSGAGSALQGAGSFLESFGRTFFDQNQKVDKRARPEDVGRVTSIIEELLGRARGDDRYMALVDNILARSAEEFAPTRAGESSTGSYGTTTLELLQNDARSRAVAMAQAAILQAQQAAFDEAGRLSSAVMEANSTTEMKSKAPLGFLTRPVSQVGSKIGDTVGTVICTELARQGKFDHKLLNRSYRWAKVNLSEATWRGYHAWGIPAAKAMQTSRILTAVLGVIARSRAEYLHGEGSVFGLIVHLTATPSCWLLGTILNWLDCGRDLKPRQAL